MSDNAHYDRGNTTRENLLKAGVLVFSELGFDAASTRHLASQAGVNLAAIPYHFESKKGLYLAVAEYVAEQIGRRMLPTVEGIASDAGQPGFDDRAAREALSQLLANMAQLLVGVPEADAWAGFILREQAQPTEAFDVLYDNTMGRVLGSLFLLVGQLTGRDAHDPRARLASIAIMGQLMIFRTSRAGVLRSMGWDAYTPARTKLLLEVIERQTDAILSAAREDHDQDR